MCEENVKVEETVAETAENTEEVTEAVEEKADAVEIEPLFEEFVDFDTFSKSDFRVVKVKECTPERMIRSVPVPSSSTNCRSFLLFLTAVHSLTFTTRKNDGN